MIKNTLIYTRVSSEEPKKPRLCLRDQKQQLENFCDRNGYNIVGFYEEAHSAKDFNRPEFQKMLHELESGEVKADLLLVARPDRFSRNLEESLKMIKRLEKLGVTLCTPEKMYDSRSMSDSDFLVSVIEHTLPEVDNIKRSKSTETQAA